MNIHVEIIPHDRQRYSTSGDWFFDEWGDLQIKVDDVGHWKSETMVAIHEIIEALLCKDRGIKETDVTKFDTDHPELEDPGLSVEAPYYEEHKIATYIERDVCLHLREDWNEHYERI